MTMNLRNLSRAVAVALLLVAVNARIFCAEAGRFRVQFLDVGQADACLVTCPDGKHHLLIDSGDRTYPRSQENFRAALPKVIPVGARLDMAIASHPHADHIGGMEWVLKNYAVGTYIDNGRPAETATWASLDALRRQRIKNGRLNYINATKASLTKIKLCDKVSLQLIVPAAVAKLSDPNDQSVGVRIESLGKSFLFVGDMEKDAELAWLKALPPAARKLVDVDVLKVGHHGSDTSSTAEFVQAVSPELAFVMCGARGVGTNARYKHPRASTLEIYANWFDLAFKHKPPGVAAPDEPLWAYNAATKNWEAVRRPTALWATMADGNITLDTDGARFFVSTHKSPVP